MKNLAFGCLAFCLYSNVSYAAENCTVNAPTRSVQVLEATTTVVSFTNCGNTVRGGFTWNNFANSTIVFQQRNGAGRIPVDRNHLIMSAIEPDRSRFIHYMALSQKEMWFLHVDPNNNLNYEVKMPALKAFNTVGFMPGDYDTSVTVYAHE